MLYRLDFLSQKPKAIKSGSSLTLGSLRIRSDSVSQYAMSCSEKLENNLASTLGGFNRVHAIVSFAP